MDIEIMDIGMIVIIVLFVGFAFGVGTMYFQITKMEVCKDCVCESQRYVDQGCDYSPDSGWVCTSGSIERVTP